MNPLIHADLHNFILLPAESLLWISTQDKTSNIGQTVMKAQEFSSADLSEAVAVWVQ